MVVSRDSLVLNLSKFKGKQAQQTKQLTVPSEAPLARAIRRYVFWWDSGNRGVGSLFGFDEQLGTQPSSFVTRALTRLLPLVTDRSRLDSSLSLSSHALRRGAAVSMQALGVSIHRILDWADWSSPRSMATYVRGRVNVATLPSDSVSFGWMVPSGLLSS